MRADAPMCKSHCFRHKNRQIAVKIINVVMDQFFQPYRTERIKKEASIY